MGVAPEYGETTYRQHLTGLFGVKHSLGNSLGDSTLRSVVPERQVRRRGVVSGPLQDEKNGTAPGLSGLPPP